MCSQLTHKRHTAKKIIHAKTHTHTHGATNISMDGHLNTQRRINALVTHGYTTQTHTRLRCSSSISNQALINTHSTDSSLLPWRPPTCCQRGGGWEFGGEGLVKSSSKLSRFNFSLCVREPPVLLQAHTITHLGTENSFIHFHCDSIWLTSVQGNAPVLLRFVMRGASNSPHE